MADQYFLLFFISFILSFLLTPILKKYGLRRGFVDPHIDDRKIHDKPVPHIGGVAIFSAVLLPFGILFGLHYFSFYHFNISLSEMWPFFPLMFFVFILGLIDDVFNVNPAIKFIFQVLLGIFAYSIGFGIQNISAPIFADNINLGIWGLPLTILWFVGITNAFNLIDGVDGLAAGLGLIASTVMFFVSLYTGHTVEAFLSAALAGSILGFLRYNFHPASIFLGDCGSMLIGFSLAALSITASQKSTTAVIIFIPFMVFGVPILDTIIAFIRRSLAGRPVFQADREHIHHKLLDKGWKQKKVTFVLYGIGALFGLYSLIFVNPTSKFLGYSLLIVLVFIVVGVQRIGYEEFRELLRYITKGLRSQSRQLAFQIQIRKFFHDLNANGELVKLEEFFDRLVIIFSEMGFDYVSLRIWERYLHNHGKGDFVWQRTEIPFQKGAWRITLPLHYTDNKTASLTLSKLNGNEVIPMRLSAIVQDLPVYLEEFLEKLYEKEQILQQSNEKIQIEEGIKVS